MAFIYFDDNQIYKYNIKDKCSNKILNHIRPNNVKYITYDTNYISLVEVSNGLHIIHIKNSGTSEYIYSGPIKEIDMASYELLILYNNNILELHSFRNEIVANIMKDENIISTHGCDYFHIIRKKDGLYCFTNKFYFMNNIQYSDMVKGEVLEIIEDYYLFEIDMKIKIDIESIYCASHHFIIKSKNDIILFDLCGRNKSNILYYLSCETSDNNLIYKYENFNRNGNKIIDIKCGHIYSYILNSNNDLWKLHNYDHTCEIILNIKEHNINKFWILSDDRILYLKNETQLYYDDVLLFENNNLEFIHNTRINFNWNPEIHKYFTVDFNNNVIILYIILKRWRNRIVIPKYVIYIIINYLISYNSNIML